MKGNFLLRSAGLIYLISDLVYLRMQWVDTLILSVPVYVTIGGTKSRDDSYADLCHQLLETSIVDIVAAERDCSATIPGHYHRSVLRTEYIVYYCNTLYSVPAFNLFTVSVPPR